MSLVVNGETFKNLADYYHQKKPENACSLQRFRRNLKLGEDFETAIQLKGNKQKKPSKQRNKKQKNNNELYKLYVVHVNTNVGWIYKIGLTTRTVDDRFKSRISNQYELQFVAHGTKKECFFWESVLKKNFADKRINKSHTLGFHGHTECFHLNDDDIKATKVLLSNVMRVKTHD